MGGTANQSTKPLPGALSLSLLRLLPGTLLGAFIKTIAPSSIQRVGQSVLLWTLIQGDLPEPPLPYYLDRDLCFCRV